MTVLLDAHALALRDPFAAVLASSTPDEAFGWITAVLAAQTSRRRASNSYLVAFTGSDLALDWFESNVDAPVSNHWGIGAALSGVPWPRIEAWLKCGGPRMLMALDTLYSYRNPAPGMSPLVQIAAPALPQAPSRSQFEHTLAAVLEAHDSPGVKSSVEAVLLRSAEILGRDSRTVAVCDLPSLFLYPERFDRTEPVLEQHPAIPAQVRESIAKTVKAMTDEQFISNADLFAFHKATGCPVMKVKQVLFAMEPELRAKVYQAAMEQPGARCYHDPIEDEPAMREAIRAAARQAEMRVGPVGRGGCHLMWREQERILAAQGIRWYSPVAMNPGSAFD